RIPYARGLVTGSYKGLTTVNHSGATGGYRAWLERLPGSGLSVAVLCNGGSINPPAIGRKLVDAVLAPKDVPLKAVADKALDGRAGLYVNGATGEAVRLAASDGKLRFGDGPLLTPLGKGRYENGGAAIRFM